MTSPTTTPPPQNTWADGSQAHANTDGERPRDEASRWKLAITAGMLTAAIYTATFIVGDKIIPQGLYLNAIGIHPGNPESILDIFTYGFAHASASHLLTNLAQLVPLIIGAVLVRDWREVLFVALATTVVSGAVVWATTPEDSLVIGASGVVAGFASYVTIRAARTRHPVVFLVGGLCSLVTILGFLVASASPIAVSWQAHLSGFIMGIIFGLVPLYPGVTERIHLRTGPRYDWSPEGEEIP